MKICRQMPSQHWIKKFTFLIKFFDDKAANIWKAAFIGDVNPVSYLSTEGKPD